MLASCPSIQRFVHHKTGWNHPLQKYARFSRVFDCVGAFQLPIKVQADPFGFGWHFLKRQGTPAY